MPALLRRLLSRVEPRLSNRARSAFATTRSLIGEGPLVGLPSVDHALVIAPHPDDETIACGGTVALLTDAGARVSVTFVTDGEATRGGGRTRSAVSSARRAEARRACGVLGVTSLRFLGHPDGRVSERTAALSSDLRDALDATNPDLIVLPSALDTHPDHEAVNLALARAAPRHGEIWGGEVWQPVPATRLVDVSSVVDRKRAALAEHTTAGHATELQAFLALNRYRSVHGLRGRGHAEAFLALPAADYVELLGS